MPSFWEYWNSTTVSHAYKTYLHFILPIYIFQGFWTYCLVKMDAVYIKSQSSHLMASYAIKCKHVNKKKNFLINVFPNIKMITPSQNCRLRFLLWVTQKSYKVTFHFHLQNRLYAAERWKFPTCFTNRHISLSVFFQRE